MHLKRLKCCGAIRKTIVLISKLKVFLIKTGTMENATQLNWKSLITRRSRRKLSPILMINKSISNNIIISETLWKRDLKILCHLSVVSRKKLFLVCYAVALCSLSNGKWYNGRMFPIDFGGTMKIAQGK